MKKPILAALIAALGPGAASAQGVPSSKASAAVNTAVSCKVASTPTLDGTAPLTCKDIWSGNPSPVTTDNFATIMSVPMKLSASQSLFVSPTLVTGLYTQTTTKTSTGSTSKATAMGGVYLRAVLSTDPAGLNVVKIADPVGMCTNDILGCQKVGSEYGVVLDQRIQSLTQTLSDCVVNVTVAGTPLTGTCSFDSTLDLLLQTTSAHGFNFIFPNVGQGTYYVVIQAALDANATVGGTAAAVGSAAFGLGSVTVESVRLVHDFSF
jgi:hypothetical protein